MFWWREIKIGSIAFIEASFQTNAIHCSRIACKASKEQQEQQQAQGSL